MDLSKAMLNSLEEDKEMNLAQYLTSAENGGWYQSLFGLSQGDIRRFEDITKLNIHTCLYALSYMKEKAEVESKNIKSKFNR